MLWVWLCMCVWGGGTMLDKPRLASSVGVGGSSVKHACDVGSIFGLEVFKFQGFAISIFQFLHGL